MPKQVELNTGLTQEMAIKRRGFVAQAAALIALPMLGSLSTPARGQGLGPRLGSGLFFSAWSDQHEQHFIGVFHVSGQLYSRFPVPSRGHSACVSHDGRFAVFFARRPGRWMCMLDLNGSKMNGSKMRGGKMRKTVAAIDGRHFFGHGVFSPDARRLFVSENDYANNRGVIGVYETDNLKRIGEFPSFGVEPHELAILSGGKTLVVANGGIETHPDFERRKLNLSSMASSLAYIDLASATVQERVEPPHHQLSLRHLTVTPDDRVIVGAQYQGPAGDDQALMFAHASGGELIPLSGQPLTAQRALNQYIASVICCGGGQFVLGTAPRGGKVSIWDVHRQSWIADIDLHDVAGGALTAQLTTVLLTSGSGAIYAMEIGRWQARLVHRQPRLHWDNHLAASYPLV